MEAYHLVSTVLVTASDMGMDDSDGGLTMLTARCQDAWRRVFETASDAQREDLYQLFQVEIGCFEHDFIRDEVGDLARYWKEYHLNRPAMKDELRKAGF